MFVNKWVIDRSHKGIELHFYWAHSNNIRSAELHMARATEWYNFHPGRPTGSAISDNSPKIQILSLHEYWCIEFDPQLDTASWSTGSLTGEGANKARLVMYKCPSEIQ